MNKLIVMEKIECQYYLSENCIKTLKSCVCGKVHRFYYKTDEFDKANFTNPVSIYRFCSNKPLELVIIKQNKDNKTKLDWSDTEAVKEYKRQKKKEADERKKVNNTPPNSPDNTPIQDEPVKHKKKIIIIKKK